MLASTIMTSAVAIFANEQRAVRLRPVARRHGPDAAHLPKNGLRIRRNALPDDFPQFGFERTMIALGLRFQLFHDLARDVADSERRHGCLPGASKMLAHCACILLA